MSDGSNDFELFKGPAAKEKDEKSDEKFRDEMRQTQAAMAQLQKDEGQAKKQDFGLAAILVQFLSQPQFTDLFLLISRVVALNIPSDFIIAIVSLIDPRSQQEVQRLLPHKADHAHLSHAALAIRHEVDFQALGAEQKKALEQWVSDLAHVGKKSVDRLLETMLVPGPEIRVAPLLVQLAAFVVRYYLESQHVPMEFQRIRDFSENALAEVAKALAHDLKSRKQIEAA